ncbi:MAG: DUF433 domain-containing protein [Saprospiraceae bacterium]|nr:DUF433 domain-containing protein [Saprospiraceae bacterium]
MINWQSRIHSDPGILSGKPVIRGTRLSVEFILERLADGWTEKEILENYPRLAKEDMLAVFAYSYECMKDGLLFQPQLKSA